ncbi:hypothetical protein CQA70_29590, partial [Klebsiella pneumoniae]
GILACGSKIIALSGDEKIKNRTRKVLFFSRPADQALSLANDLWGILACGSKIIALSGDEKIKNRTRKVLFFSRPA